MTDPIFTSTIYRNDSGVVSWHGVCIKDCDTFNSFIARNVTARLYDEEGGTEFESCLRGIANTGFARNSLNAILAAEVREERDWAIGEAIAEAYLESEHNITWPWNMRRDRRNPNASLPGADLIGFQETKVNVRLVLGEVKTSSDRSTPPGVMNGRSGMLHQIDKLATDLSLICQLLKWLYPRCKGTQYETQFKTAVGFFFDSENKAISLYGILIRDTTPNEQDLEARGQAVSRKLQEPTTCYLIALYLPCQITDLNSHISRGGP